LFLDVGANGTLRRQQLQLDTNGLQQLQNQFPGSTINRAIGFAPRSNFKPRVSTGIQFVVQLPVVNAPFRLYWAYNPVRHHQTIIAPIPTCQAGIIDCGSPISPSDQTHLRQIGALDLILFQLRSRQPQTVNFFDPLRTFRFTVSRTF